MIICMANSKGGTGKTSVAINLLAHLDIDYIIDIDPTHRGISSLMSLSNSQIAIHTPKSKDEILRLTNTDKNVLIDCGGFDSDFILYAISQSDVVLSPSSDDPTEQFGLANFNEVMKKASNLVDEKIIAKVILNRVHPSRRDFSIMKEFVSSLSHLELLPIHIPASSQIPKSQFKGEAVKSGTIAVKFNAIAKLITTSKLHHYDGELV